MKRIGYLWGLLFCLLGHHSQAQNEDYVLNGDFEDLEQIPYEPGQVNFLHSWECRSKIKEYGSVKQWLHSPDLCTPYYYPSLNIFPTHPNKAHSGNNYVGMQPYELIQERFLNQKMKAGEYYTLSMYVWLANDDPTWWKQNIVLSAFLSQGQTQYDKEEDQMCSDKYTSYKDSENHRWKVGEQKIDLSIYPTGNWHRVSFTFKAPDFIKIKWGYLVIDLIKPGYESKCTLDPCGECEGGYMYIDDVQLQPAEFCNVLCAPNLGSIHFTSEPGNALQATCKPWLFTVQNTIGIDFEVFDRWGQSVYSQRAFDVNGLKDNGYSDYLFAWMGYLDNGSILKEDVYNYKLRLWNCNGDIKRTGDLSYFKGNCPGKQGYDVFNGSLKECCPRELYFQNINFTDVYKHGAEQNIYAGESVTSAPKGPVKVLPGAELKFIAGNAIFLEPGFYVLPGAVFTMSIAPCAYAQKTQATDRRDLFNESMTQATVPDSVEEPSIYPNPSEGIFYLDHLKMNSKVETVEVYTLQGTQVHRSALKETARIDLQALPTGIYIMKLLAREKILSVRKIIIER